MMRGVFSRAFGTWSGLGEVEAIAVDRKLGYVYYSDAGYGVRKYLADPSAEDAEDQLAEFGLNGFAEDHEGIESEFRRRVTENTEGTTRSQSVVPLR